MVHVLLEINILQYYFFQYLILFWFVAAFNTFQKLLYPIEIIIEITGRN